MVSDSHRAPIRESTRASVWFKSLNPRGMEVPIPLSQGLHVAQILSPWEHQCPGWAGVEYQRKGMINNWCFQVTCKCKISVRQWRGGDVAVTEIGADRCLMESRITDLPGFTCNHQLLRFPLSSPLLLGLLQGQRLGEGRMGIFRLPVKFPEMPLISWPLPSWNHNLPVWQGDGSGFLVFKTRGAMDLTPQIHLLSPNSTVAACVRLRKARPQRNSTAINRAKWLAHCVPGRAVP